MRKYVFEISTLSSYLTSISSGGFMIIAERRRRCLEQDENAENTNQPPPTKSKGHLQSQGFDLN